MYSFQAINSYDLYLKTAKNKYENAHTIPALARDNCASFLKMHPKCSVLLNGRSRPLGSHSAGHTAHFCGFGYWIHRDLQYTMSNHRWPWPGILHRPSA